MNAPTRSPALPPPTGTVTFFFSDIEGSTRIVDALPEQYPAVLQLHREAMRAAFAEHAGVERGTEGDSFFVAFADASDAVAAAVAATRGLAAVPWPEGVAVRVRIGLHTGEGRLVDDDYVGIDVHRAARIAAAAHGGQVVVSQSTRILAERNLPEGVSFRDLGEHRLKDLPAPEHLHQLIIAGQQESFPPLRSLARRVTNLPAQLAEIVGREQDVSAIRELLDRSRLVTITGAGGTGKTRLAQEVARLIVEAGGMDAAFVPLQALSDTELIPVEILRALHLDIAAARDPLERIVEHFAERRALIVLDNLEQLDGAGAIVRALLDGTSGLTVLAASQAALHVAGEREYALGTLPVPAATTDLEVLAANASVRLFVDRARAVRADFALDAANAGAIVALSAKLDGLPLAIELAAAQSKLLSPRAILDRIAGHLDALASRRDDLPARQRTLRATVAWSYELLGDAERRLFRRLAAFTGGARLSEIEAIAGSDPAVPSPVDVLGTLVDRSLVTMRPGQHEDDRFGLLETIRIYGRELLREHGEEAAVLGAHAAIFQQLAHEAEPEFYRASRRAWLDRLAGDHDNLRAALDHLEESGDVAAALDMVADLWRFWYSRGHLLEGRERVDRLLAAASAPGASVSALVLSRAVEAAGSIRYWTRQKDERIETYYQRALDLAVESGDRSREAWATYNLAFVFDFTSVASMAEPDEARALELRSRALAMFREQGDRRGVAESLWALGGNAIVTREGPERARRFLGEASELLTELGDDYGLSWVHVSAGMIEANEGNLDVALDHVLLGADVFVRDGDAAGEVLAVQAIASLAARRGDDVTAVRFAAAAQAATRELGADLPRIPPIVDPITELWARFPADDLRREGEVGVALGVKAILANALAQLESHTS